MSTEREALERLTRAAARVSVAEQDDRALARLALRTGKARAQARSRRRTVAWATASVVLVLLAGGWSQASHTLPSSPITRHSTPVAEVHAIAVGQSDRVHLASGARLTVDSVDSTSVKLRLDEGAAVFDVEPGRARRFEVATQLGTVVVRGTVFAVGVRPPHDLTVHVYEGVVEVTTADEISVLTSNETLNLGARVDIPSELERRAQAAAHGRVGRDDVPATDALDDSAASRMIDVVDPRSSRETSPVLPPTRTPRGVRPPTLETLRAMCARGEYEAVVTAMTRSPVPTTMRDEWYFVIGDAYRGLHRTREAAEAYRAAVTHATPSRAAVAGLSAAQQLAAIGDPSTALTVLHETQATTLGAVVDEPASALELELLLRLGRSDEARRAAARYLAAFPSGPHERAATEVVNLRAPE